MTTFPLNLFEIPFLDTIEELAELREREGRRRPKTQYEKIGETYERYGAVAALEHAWAYEEAASRAFILQTDRALGKNHTGRNPRGKSREMIERAR